MNVYEFATKVLNVWNLGAAEIVFLANVGSRYATASDLSQLE